MEQEEVGGPRCICGHVMLAHHWKRGEGYLQCCAMDNLPSAKGNYNKRACRCKLFVAAPLHEEEVA